MPYYNRQVTQELEKKDYFFFYRDMTDGELCGFFDLLKKKLEPEKQDEKADLNGDILHNAVAAVCACPSYELKASKEMCRKFVGANEQLSYGELLIRYLCKMGADVNHLNSQNQTPIFNATSPHIIRVLRKLGAKVTQMGYLRADRVWWGKCDVNSDPKTVIYLRMKENNKPALAALLEQMPGCNNIQSYRASCAYYYKEGEYSAYFTRLSSGKVEVQHIQRKIKSCYRSISDNLWPMRDRHYI